MKIHEYQAKRILSRYGVPVPRGGVASTPAEARSVAEAIGPRAVLKAQIHAGGRGQGRAASRSPKTPRRPNGWPGPLIGMTLVTHQTGPEGKAVKLLLVEEAIDVARELYLGIVIDRASESAVLNGLDRGRHGRSRRLPPRHPSASSRNMSIPAPACRPFRPASWPSGSACRARL